jgi:hypothetical protein
MECGKTFRKALKAGTYEVRCPHCGGYDTDVAMIEAEGQGGEASE